MEKKVTEDSIDDFFIDLTYKIIPKKQKRYKLMTVTGLDKLNNNSYICFLILLCYEDQISFERLFKYLKENYGFTPKYVHLDYSKALRNALLADNIFSVKPKNTLFFSFRSKYNKKNENIKNNKIKN